MDSVGRNIYLAGKITAWSKGCEDWRFDIVPSLTYAVERGWLNELLSPPDEWHYLPQAIFGRFHYVGPFFTDLEDFACGHGAGLTAFPHGLNPEESRWWKHGADTPIVRRMVTQLCLKAIRRADLVFAWIDTPDCYGTLFELGYAKALGKRLAVYFAQDAFLGKETTRPYPYGDEEDVPDPLFELWFTYCACQGQIAHGTPTEALQETIAALGWDCTYASPLEAAFAEEWGNQSLHLIYPLTSQQPVKNGAYRLDFAYAPAMFGIELDGYTYHGDRASFTKDRQRQREIEALGWHIVRFSGDELRRDMAACVREAARLLDIHKRTKE